MTSVCIYSRSGADSKEQFVGGLLPTTLRAVRVQLYLTNGLTSLVMAMVVSGELRVKFRLIVTSGQVRL